jgi:ribosomal protein S18 acetylase RimI-like enzyme
VNRYQTTETESYRTRQATSSGLRGRPEGRRIASQAKAIRMSRTALKTNTGLRPYSPERDEQAAVALINADRITGQPLCTAAMLREATAGRSRIDSGWWLELDRPNTEVLEGSAGLAGIVSYAWRPKDRCGIILWLHTREDQAVAEQLILTAWNAMAGAKTFEAFPFATALTAGLEALPRRHRPATHATLHGAGFKGRDLWRYMHLKMERDRIIAPDIAVQIEKTSDQTWKLLSHEIGGEAHVEIFSPGLGVLWWISIDPKLRGLKGGSKMLNASLNHLLAEGAKEVILYVDDDESGPGQERDRTAANRLYEKTGFQEVDRLFSYRRQVRP